MQQQTMFEPSQDAPSVETPEVPAPQELSLEQAAAVAGGPESKNQGN